MFERKTWRRSSKLKWNITFYCLAGHRALVVHDETMTLGRHERHILGGSSCRGHATDERVGMSCRTVESDCRVHFVRWRAPSALEYAFFSNESLRLLMLGWSGRVARIRGNWLDRRIPPVDGSQKVCDDGFAAFEVLLDWKMRLKLVVTHQSIKSRRRRRSTEVEKTQRLVSLLAPIFWIQDFLFDPDFLLWTQKEEEAVA